MDRIMGVMLASGPMICAGIASYNVWLATNSGNLAIAVFSGLISIIIAIQGSYR